jgi:hypothetical protein
VRVIGAGNPAWRWRHGRPADRRGGRVARQGLSAFDAASAGALLHSLAGDAAAGELGQRGLLPRTCCRICTGWPTRAGPESACRTRLGPHGEGL